MNKVKMGLSLSQDLLALMNENCKKLGFSGRSELVETAVYEYISKSIIKRLSDTAATVYEQIDTRAMASLEDRMAKLLYKNAIELAQINLLLCRAYELDERDVHTLRREACALIQQSHGRVSFADIVKSF